MKLLRIIALALFSLCLFPMLASAQSYWLHRQVYAPSGFRRLFHVAAADSEECVFLETAPGALRTLDYANSWNGIFHDTSTNGNINAYHVPCFVHPSRNLIILGCDAEKTVTRRNGNVSTTLKIEAGHVLRSSDAGQIWTDTALGYLDTTKVQNSIGSMAALDSNHIFLPIDAKSFNPSDSDHFLHSSDGGLTWQSIPCPVSVHYRGSADPSTAWITPVGAYPAPNTLVIAEWDAYTKDKIYRSTDLGTSWDTGFQMNDNTTCFAFVNARIGFASGYIYDGTNFTATIDKTTDGGITWTTVFSQQVSPPSAYFKNTAGLYGIAFADSLHGLACGDQGLILRTTDGGTTWNQMTSDFTFDDQGLDLLGSVAYPDTNHAIIASSSGEALVYQPNGLLELPNITYPKFSPPSAPKTFDVTWDPVPNATRYSITITTSGYPDSTMALVAEDSNVTTTLFHLSNLVDTSPPPATGGRQYEIYLQAFNTTNRSNVATRGFIVYQGANGVATILPNDTTVEVYPNPATNWLDANRFCGPVTVLDMLGRILHCPYQSGKLDISSLPAGIYYVSDGRSRAEFVKE